MTSAIRSLCGRGDDSGAWLDVSVSLVQASEDSLGVLRTTSTTSSPSCWEKVLESRVDERQASIVDKPFTYEALGRAVRSILDGPPLDRAPGPAESSGQT